MIAIQRYLQKLQEHSDEEFKTKFSALWETGEAPKFTASVGTKYIKVVESTKSGHRAVFCFIHPNTGDIYKADSWSKPAKHVRGNVKDEHPPMTLGAMCLRH